MVNKTIDEKEIAKKLIIDSLKMEESLISVLKTEVKMLNKKINDNVDYAELQKLNKTLRHIIYVITILDDRIDKGLEILNNSKENHGNKL